MKSLVLFAFLFSIHANASRNVVEASVDVTSELQSVSGAKQEMFQSAVEKVSERYVKEIIGEAKFSKNLELIQQKVIANSKKYILFMKGGEEEKLSDRYTMSVTLKLSLKSLRDLLLAQGLLYEIEGPPKVLPLVSFENRTDGSSYSWWVDVAEVENQGLRSLQNKLYDALKKELAGKGFYAIPAGKASAKNSLPGTLRLAEAPTEDLLMIGEFFKAQIVVLGRVQIKKSRKRPDAFEIHVRESAHYTSNGRVVGEVIRKFETAAGSLNSVALNKAAEVFPVVAKDLTVQIYEAWKSGTFGSSLLKLSILGEFSFNQVASLKESLLEKVPALKSMTERKFGPKSVVFEVDAGGSAEELVKALKGLRFDNFALSVKTWSSDNVSLQASFN